MNYAPQQPARKAAWRRHPVLVGGAALLAGWMLLEGWYVTVGVVAAVVLLLTVRRARRNRRVRHAALLARAEFENRLTQLGDQRGVFGRYPPVQAGWYPDPAQSRWQWRYFDGALWTGYAVRR